MQNGAERPLRFADFAGTWRLARRIEDRRLSRIWRFEGEALLTACADGLDYAETGTLCHSGAAALRAERRYTWRPAGQRIAVHFTDGRFFHDFDPNRPVCEARHDCAPDCYAVRYDLGAWPVWRAVWTVTGPRKDYESRSEYSRHPD